MFEIKSIWKCLLFYNMTFEQGRIWATSRRSLNDSITLFNTKTDICVVKLKPKVRNNNDVLIETQNSLSLMELKAYKIDSLPEIVTRHAKTIVCLNQLCTEGCAWSLNPVHEIQYIYPLPKKQDLQRYDLNFKKFLVQL